MEWINRLYERAWSTWDFSPVSCGLAAAAACLSSIFVRLVKAGISGTSSSSKGALCWMEGFGKVGAILDLERLKCDLWKSNPTGSELMKQVWKIVNINYIVLTASNFYILSSNTHQQYTVSRVLNLLPFATNLLLRSLFFSLPLLLDGHVVLIGAIILVLPAWCKIMVFVRSTKWCKLYRLYFILFCFSNNIHGVAGGICIQNIKVSCNGFRQWLGKLSQHHWFSPWADQQDKSGITTHGCILSNLGLHKFEDLDCIALKG